MDKFEIAAQIAAKKTRLASLKKSEPIAMMSDDFYYRNGGDAEIRSLQSEIQLQTQKLVEMQVPEELMKKAAEMYYAYNKGILATAGDSVTKAWVEIATKAS